MADIHTIPPDMKNLPEYPLSLAADLWALVFREIPLHDLMNHPAGREAIYWILEKSGKVHERHVFPNLLDPDPCAPTNVRTEKWISGPDLATLFAEKGRPGVIGFGEDEPLEPRKPSLRDDTLEKTIAALLAAWPGGPAKWPSGKDLESAASTVGIKISDDSIRKALDRAKSLML